jgi:hypothetical protein
VIGSAQKTTSSSRWQVQKPAQIGRVHVRHESGTAAGDQGGGHGDERRQDGYGAADDDVSLGRRCGLFILL